MYCISLEAIFCGFRERGWGRISRNSRVSRSPPATLLRSTSGRSSLLFRVLSVEQDSRNRSPACLSLRTFVCKVLGWLSHGRSLSSLFFY